MLGRPEKKSAIHFGGTMTSFLGIMAVLAFFVFSVLIFSSFLTAQPAHAQVEPVGSSTQVALGLEFASDTGLTTTDIRTTVSRIIRIFLGLLGLVAVLIIMYAGFTWMTAGGSEEKISKAKKLLINGFIGLIIILSSYAIVSFLFRAILEGPGGSGGGSTASPLTSLYGAGRGTGALGSGIIDYHYPEAGQVDVPRNTKISLTLKRPLVLSTVIRGYYDNNSYTLTDDWLCENNVPDPNSDPPPSDSDLSNAPCTRVWDDGLDEVYPAVAADFKLKMTNVKIVKNEDLADPEAGGVNEQFDQRYLSVMTSFPSVKLSDVQADGVDPEEGQALIITPADNIGSPSEDTNYRVALRGGLTGVKVWAIDNSTNEEFIDDAFEDMAVDGSYFWGFTVGTELDLTPPKVKNIEPGSKYWDPNEEIFRNQILQVYFDEAIDPTSASGCTGIGIGCGFSKLFVQAKCTLTPPGCGDIEGIPLSDSLWTTVSGEVLVTNRYKTAEFTPSTACDSVSENSCGDPVYCLPKYADLRVIVRAASVDPNAADDADKPPAASQENGVLDMVGNSFDGNMTGTAEGQGVFPQSDTDTTVFNGYLVNDHSLTKPADTDLLDASGDFKMFDDLIVEFFVGNKIDLIPPFVTGISPLSAGFDEPPESTVSFPEGPSDVPPEEPIVIEWSKVLRGSSMRTGSDGDSDATVIIKAHELLKVGVEPCESSACAPNPLPEQLAPIAFFWDAEIQEVDDDQVTKLSLIHRPFFTGNDLGYTLEEMDEFAALRPRYVPVLKSKIQDTRQNCFYPSQGFDCGTLETGPIIDPDNPPITSCCDRTKQDIFACPL